jgi:two-component system, sensor histidine kinase and response regulator
VKLIDLFSSYAEPTLIKGVQAFDAGDLEELGRAAHSVRSSACNLGAREVENLALAIEQLAAKGESISIKPLLADLEKAFSRAKDRLGEVKKGLMQ